MSSTARPWCMSHGVSRPNQLRSGRARPPAANPAQLLSLESTTSYCGAVVCPTKGWADDELCLVLPDLIDLCRSFFPWAPFRKTEAVTKRRTL